MSSDIKQNNKIVKIIKRLTAKTARITITVIMKAKTKKKMKMIMKMKRMLNSWNLNFLSTLKQDH